MLLHLAVEVGRVEIVLVAGHLKLLIDPALGLVAVTLKLLELVGVFEHGSSHSRLLQQLGAPFEQQRPSLGHILSSIVLTLNQLGGKLIQGLDLLLLRREALLKILMLLDEGLHRVQGVPQVLVVQEGLLFGHPGVGLLRVPVEQLEVHALLVEDPPLLPEPEQEVLLLGQE